MESFGKRGCAPNGEQKLNLCEPNISPSMKPTSNLRQLVEDEPMLSMYSNTRNIVQVELRGRAYIQG